MTVTVLLFAALREAVGTGEIEVAAEAGATAGDVLARLADEHAEIARYRPIVRLAVNRAYAPPETALADGDEVALITPTSGG